MTFDLKQFTEQQKQTKSMSKNIFLNYLDKETIFRDKLPLGLKFIPKLIQHREQEIEYVSHVLKPCLKLEKPSNLLVYGQSGTGKTLIVKNVCETLKIVAQEKEIPLKVVYLNCGLRGVADTDYRLLSQICAFFGRVVPKTGLSTKDIYDAFYNVLDCKEQIVVLILDEIDNLVNKCGSSFLYNLSRIDDELDNSKVSFIGISNNTSFTNFLDPRVKSSLTEEQIILDPYNANQVYDILKQRAELALKKKAYSQGNLRMISAIVAKENGDARKALNLLRVSAEIAERKGFSQIKEQNVREAEDKIEVDATERTVKSLPKQTKIVLYSTLLLSEGETSVYTGEIYNTYLSLTKKLGESCLTKRRVSGLISDLDIAGILNTKVVSHGRHGRTRRTKLNITDELVTRLRELLKFELAV